MTSSQSAKIWRSIADLLGTAPAPIALLDAPMGEGSVTPGRCDLAPAAFRAALRRTSTFNIETLKDLDHLSVYDAGEVALSGVSPADSFAPIVTRMAPLMQVADITVLVGGNNAVTRPGVHAVDPSLQRVGLLTLDAHFDLRHTDDGLMNGNPVQALLDDGMPGAHIAQIGLAPFANARYMYDTTQTEGIFVKTIGECRRIGTAKLVSEALDLLSSRCDVIYVDFDIDVIERSQAPGAPGARPGGMDVLDFFAATQIIGAHPKVRAVDLTEFDPSLDVSDTTALVAARWMAELLTGFAAR